MNFDNLDEETLNQISQFAEALMPPAQIAEILELDIDLFCIEIMQKKKNGKVYKAYRKGQLLAIYKMQSATMKMAENGSPQAVKEALNFLKKMLANEKRNHIRRN